MSWGLPARPSSALWMQAAGSWSSHVEQPQGNQEETDFTSWNEESWHCCPHHPPIIHHLCFYLPFSSRLLCLNSVMAGGFYFTCASSSFSVVCIIPSVPPGFFGLVIEIINTNSTDFYSFSQHLWNSANQVSISTNQLCCNCGERTFPWNLLFRQQLPPQAMNHSQRVPYSKLPKLNSF